MWTDGRMGREEPSREGLPVKVAWVVRNPKPSNVVGLPRRAPHPFASECAAGLACRSGCGGMNGPNSEEGSEAEEDQIQMQLQILSELSRLQSLEELSLRHCCFTAWDGQALDLPPCITQLTSLTRLDLSSSGFGSWVRQALGLAGRGVGSGLCGWPGRGIFLLAGGQQCCAWLAWKLLPQSSWELPWCACQQSLPAGPKGSCCALFVPRALQYNARQQQPPLLRYARCHASTAWRTITT